MRGLVEEQVLQFKICVGEGPPWCGSQFCSATSQSVTLNSVLTKLLKYKVVNRRSHTNNEEILKPPVSEFAQ